MSAEPSDGAPWVADATRLLRSLRQAAEQNAGELLDTAGHAPECRACALCQAVAVLRRSGPDVLDQISAFTAGLAASLRSADGSAGGAGGGSGERAAPSPEDPPPEPIVLRTERIDVTD